MIFFICFDLFKRIKGNAENTALYGKSLTSRWVATRKPIMHERSSTAKKQYKRTTSGLCLDAFYKMKHSTMLATLRHPMCNKEP